MLYHVTKEMISQTRSNLPQIQYTYNKKFIVKLLKVGKNIPIKKN